MVAIIMGNTETLFVIVFLMLLSIALSIFLKDIFNPLTLLVVPIGVGYFLYYSYISQNYTVANKTNTLYILSLFSFAFGFLWTFFLPSIKSRVRIETIRHRAYESFNRVKKHLLGLGLTGILLGSLLSIYRGLSGHGSFFFNLRYANTVENQSLGISEYLVLFLHVYLLFTVIFREKNSVSIKKIITLTAIYLSTAVYTMARTNLLTGLSSVAASYVLSNKYIFKTKVKVRVLLFTGVAFVILAYLFAVGTGKDGGNFFVDYMAYPITAFDTWILDSNIRANGTETFGFLYRIFSALNLIEYSGVELGLTSGAFNTFTFMSAPYLDFGAAGLFFIFLGLGVFYGLVYKQVRKGSPYWIVYYSILIYPLIMSFFEYQFNLSTYVYYAIILMLIKIINTQEKKRPVLAEDSSTT